MKKIAIFIIIILSNYLCISQSPEWIIYKKYDPLPQNDIKTLAFDKQENVWALYGYDSDFYPMGGIIYFDRENWIKYDTSNSELPSFYNDNIAIDFNDAKWITTRDRGLVKFENEEWFCFDTLNSELPSNQVWDIAVDNNNVKWRITSKGLASFDGVNWSIFGNSFIFGDILLKLQIDKTGNKWIGKSNRGLIKFKDDKWKVFDTTNSKLTHPSIRGIAVDSSNNLWVATRDLPIKIIEDSITFISGPIKSARSIGVEPNGDIWLADAKGGDDYGVAGWNGNSWKYLKQGETPLPQSPRSIEIDKYGNKWFCTYSNGLIVYKEGGVVNITDVEDDGKVERNKILCYPNPASGWVNVRYRVDSAGEARVFLIDALGRRRTLSPAEYKFPGDYVETFDLSALPQGTYIVVLRAGSRTYTEKLVIAR